MILSWAVGDRGAQTANYFMDDLAGRLAAPVQLTTDGHKAYLDAVAGAFGNQIDYTMLGSWTPPITTSWVLSGKRWSR